MENLEKEIRNSLLKEEKDEIISGGFKISIKENSQIEISKLTPLNVEQLELPLTLQSKKFREGGNKK